jgi:ribonuclease J
MRFKIHRGANEIGGSRVEVWTDSARIVIDLGMPLVNPDRTPFDSRKVEKQSTEELIREGILPDIPSLYQEGSKTALLISHAHQDHYGLMDRISPSCPVWLGFSTQLLIELTNSFTGKDWKVQNAHHFKNGKEFMLGDIKITPYEMDHAAFDSYAFLIESEEKSLFYSGDFRLHGRKTNNFDWFRDDFKAKVDYLLLEGTAIGRTDKPFPSENDLGEEFVKTFKETKGINLVYVSGQNITRLETIYEACVKTGKIFLVDFYTANVLTNLNKKSNKSIPFPSIQAFPIVKVYYPKALTDIMVKRGLAAETVYPFSKKHKIGKDEFDKMAEELVVVVRPSVQEDLKRYLHKYDDGCFIYSMYEGYKNQPGKTKDFVDFIESKGMPIKYIHTSGHADLSSLKKMVAVVKPKHIVPIHTFESKQYPELFKGTDVAIINDKEEVEV